MQPSARLGANPRVESMSGKAFWLVRAGLCVALATGCSDSRRAGEVSATPLSGSSGPSPSGSVNGEPLQFQLAVAPPVIPPPAIFGGITVGLVYQDWFAEGKSRHVEPPGKLDLPRVRALGGVLDLVLRTRIAPAKIEVRLFKSINDVTGIPDGEPSVTECSKTRSLCTLSFSGDGLATHARVEVGPGNRVMVVYGSWYVPASERQGFPSVANYDTCAWAVRLD